MKVILQKDVKNVGKKGDIVEVSDGYGRNFLLPKKVAVEATSNNINVAKAQAGSAARKKAQDTDEAKLMAAQLSQVIETVREAGNPPLFTEPQYSDAAAYAVSAETGAPIFALDPLASGETTPDAYEKGMLENAETLLRAFGQ